MLNIGKNRLESFLDLQFSKANMWTNISTLLSLVLWGMLWLSISPGDPKNIANPGNSVAFVHALRAVFPLMAANLPCNYSNQSG